MNIFKKFWTGISNCGIAENTRIPFAKRFKLSNQLIGLSIIFTLFYFFVYSFWGISKAVIVELVFISVYVFLLIIAKIGYSSLSRFLFVLTINIHMFCLCLCFGENSQMHLLFIPVSAIPLVLFNIKSIKTIIIFIALSIVAYILLFSVHFSSPLACYIPADLYSVMRVSFNITAIFCEIIIIYSFISNYDRAEKRLDENNILLEEQFKSIFDTSFDALFLVDHKERRIVKAPNRVPVTD